MIKAVSSKIGEETDRLKAEFAASQNKLFTEFSLKQSELEHKLADKMAQFESYRTRAEAVIAQKTAAAAAPSISSLPSPPGSFSPPSSPLSSSTGTLSVFRDCFARPHLLHYDRYGGSAEERGHGAQSSTRCLLLFRLLPLHLFGGSIVSR